MGIPSLKIWTLMVGLVSSFGGATTASADAPCGQITFVGRGVQLIPPKGPVQTRFKEADPIACGAMVISHQEPLWIRLANQVVLKVAPNTFIEIAKASNEKFKLLRGEILLNSPARQTPDVWVTPNAEFEFKGGVAWFQYTPKDKKSSTASFNRSVRISNKFNPDAFQDVNAGETSSLAIQEARVKPTVPTVMSHLSAVDALKRMKLSEDEMKQLIAVVKQVYEDRGSALASEIGEWQDSEDSSEGPSRSIASVPQSEKKAIDEREAAFTLAMLKRKLYGDPKEVAKVENQRVPASIQKPVALFQDVERDSRERRFQGEVKKVGREIDRMRPEDTD